MFILCVFGMQHLWVCRKEYPFYAVQWHPEKAGFEWTPAESINHSQHAITAMQAAANFFVSEG